MAALPRPDDAELSPYEAAVVELLAARTAYDQTPAAHSDDPASVLRHDAAADRVRAAERRYRAALLDIREGRDPTPLEEWDDRATPLVRGIVLVLAITSLTVCVCTLWLGHGAAWWVALAALVAEAGVVVVAARMWDLGG